VILPANDLPFTNPAGAHTLNKPVNLVLVPGLAL